MGKCVNLILSELTFAAFRKCENFRKIESVNEQFRLKKITSSHTENAIPLPSSI